MSPGIVPAMLGRYRIVRGKRAPDDPLPVGVRMDTRKHTNHVLRPDAAAVAALFAEFTAARWRAFAGDYEALLAARFAADRAPFDAIAAQARTGDVWLGCSCPSAQNPDVSRCHTVLALRFLAKRYRDVKIVLP